MSNKLFVVSKMTSRKIFVTGTSLPGQWLGLHISTAGSTQVQSLVRELRSCKLCSMAKNTFIHFLKKYLMHETSAQGWCTGKTQRNGMEREAGGGDRDGEHM